MLRWGFRHPRVLVKKVYRLFDSRIQEGFGNRTSSTVCVTMGLSRTPNQYLICVVVHFRVETETKTSVNVIDQPTVPSE